MITPQKVKERREWVKSEAIRAAEKSIDSALNSDAQIFPYRYSLQDMSKEIVSAIMAMYQTGGWDVTLSGNYLVFEEPK